MKMLTPYLLVSTLLTVLEELFQILYSPRFLKTILLSHAERNLLMQMEELALDMMSSLYIILIRSG